MLESRLVSAFPGVLCRRNINIIFVYTYIKTIRGKIKVDMKILEEILLLCAGKKRRIELVVMLVGWLIS